MDAENQDTKSKKCTNRPVGTMIFLKTSVYSVITKDYHSKQRDPHFNKVVLCNIDLKTVR